MAGLDVSFVVEDPLFADEFTVIHKTQVMGADGRVKIVERQEKAIGTITMASGDDLDRLPDGAQQHGSITINTKMRLTDGHGKEDADEVIAFGHRYIVGGVEDYSHFGYGFVIAHCTPKPVSGGTISQ